jgi:hypothetical protein
MLVDECKQDLKFVHAAFIFRINMVEVCEFPYFCYKTNRGR